jgi:hypothetical protein
MNKNPRRKLLLHAIASCVLLTVAAGVAEAAAPLSEQLEPAEIPLGSAAQLTISDSGGGASFSPPTVPGLEFVAVGQSTQVETVNGQSTSTSSVTYQVIPNHEGTFSIPNAAVSSAPLVLRVTPANATGASAGAFASATPTLPAGGSSADVAQMTRDGLAFVRVLGAKRQPYVGESIPVDIQVGVHAGMEASLDGLPTLHGDAFTLGKLDAKPAQTQEIVHGSPFTVLTWHSVLVPIKSGELSLTMEVPLTAAVPVQAPAPADISDDDSVNAIFNDPFFRSAMRQTEERHLDLISAPTHFDVRELPVEHRPADFSGAVGNFAISSAVSATSATEGDPLTLTLHVTGSGNFDRVDSPMLSGVDGWKTYPATATFTPADSAGDRGDKTFSEPVIATQAGTRTLPALSFSFFNPQTGDYETAHTASQSIAIAAAPAGSAAAGNDASVADAPAGGLRPDHAVRAEAISSLLPRTYQPAWLALPSLLTLAIAGAWFGARRRESGEEDDSLEARDRAAIIATRPLFAQMDMAAATANPTLFFHAARAALQEIFASRWQVAPRSITTAEVDARLADHPAVREVFMLADETSYSGLQLRGADFQRWRAIVAGQIQPGATP